MQSELTEESFTVFYSNVWMTSFQSLAVINVFWDIFPKVVLEVLLKKKLFAWTVYNKDYKAGICNKKFHQK